MVGKDLYGFIAVGISSAACVHYIVTILKGKTKPHAFTWVIWSLVMGIVCAAQWGSGAGAGAWNTAASSFFCLVIFLLSLIKGEKNITTTDWLALGSALAILPLWYLTKSALWAVIFSTLIDFAAYYPTFRKAWIRPQEEDYLLYASDDIKWLFALLAMSDYSATTLIYPFFCMVANSAVAVMLVCRRRLRTF